MPYFKNNKSTFDQSCLLDTLKLIPKDLLLFLKTTNGGQVVQKNEDKETGIFYLKFVVQNKQNRLTESGIIAFLGTNQSSNLTTDINYAHRLLYQDWFYETHEVDYAKKLIPFAEDNTNFFCIDTNRNNEVRYFDMSYSYTDNINTYKVLAPSFTSFLKLLINQNDGYIENLSEIYDELIAKGFK
jgi:hypothetical protein